MNVMKKQYSKPELYFEDFTLAEAIASCGTIAGPTDGDTCTWDGFLPGWPLFNQSVNADCVADYRDYEELESINVFGS